MDLAVVLAAVGLIIIIGYLAEIFFIKTNIPDVIVLILLGVLIGPVLHLIHANDVAIAANFFTTFALLFILFEGGLHIRISDLMRSMYGATVITIVNFILTIIVVSTIALLFGWELLYAILLGVILGGTSSAIVVPVVTKLKMSTNNSLILILESAFTDVLTIVIGLTLINIIDLGNVSLSIVLNSLLGNFAIAIFVGGLSGFLWILLLERFASLTKSYILSIGVLLMVYGITEFAHANGAIAGLTFGIVMGNARKILSLTHLADDTLTSSAKLFFSQISFFVKTFFFVYIGLLFNFADTGSMILAGAITAAVFLIRPISVKLSYKKTDTPSADEQVMQAMVPKGLAAAVLAQVPLRAGIPGAEKFLTPVFAVIFFTILTTTLLVFLASKGYYKGTSYLIMRLITHQPARVPKVEAKTTPKPKKRKTPTAEERQIKKAVSVAVKKEEKKIEKVAEQAAKEAEKKIKTSMSAQAEIKPNLKNSKIGSKR